MTFAPTVAILAIGGCWNRIYLLYTLFSATSISPCCAAFRLWQCLVTPGFLLHFHFIQVVANVISLHHSVPFNPPHCASLTPLSAYKNYACVSLILTLSDTLLSLYTIPWTIIILHSPKILHLALATQELVQVDGQLRYPNLPKERIFHGMNLKDSNTI